MTADLRIDGCIVDGVATTLGISDGVLVEDQDGPTLEADGLWAVPGFIDLQINGAFGHDFTSDPSTIWEVGEQLPIHGVTAFLPTIITSRPEVVVEAKAVVAKGPPAGYRGAAALGLHCEGPMISDTKRGAHPTSLLTSATDAVLKAWGGVDGITMVTIAPELDGAERIIRTLADRGVVVSLGHSDCSAEVALRALHAGALCGTHLYNAMSGLDHRHPGLAAALLLHPDAVASIIVDGVHVDPLMVKLAYRVLGPRLLLVTDAMAAAWYGEGTFDLGSTVVTVDGGKAVTAEGVLAGSVLTMDEAVRNLSTVTGCSIPAAASHATSTPARLIGASRRQTLRPGSVGDVVLLDEAGYVAATVVAGEVVEDRR